MIPTTRLLKAIGLSDDETFQTIRLGLGRSTGDVSTIADILIDGIGQFKK